MIHNLHDIDFVQVREVLQQKRHGRRAGNTTARILLMIANALNATRTTRLLFVGENNRHTADIQKITLGYLQQLSFHINTYTTKDIISSYYGNYITFTFLAADKSLPCFLRGSRYDKAFVDVTWETTLKYYKELDEIKYSLLK